VQSYAGLMEWGLTACRRALSQEESHELIGHLRAALREIEGLAAEGTGDATADVQPQAKTPKAEPVPLAAPVKRAKPGAKTPRQIAAKAPAKRAPAH
jgi:hypothetical protein